MDSLSVLNVSKTAYGDVLIISCSNLLEHRLPLRLCRLSAQCCKGIDNLSSVWYNTDTMRLLSNHIEKHKDSLV